MTPSLLPPGFILRSAAWSDIEGITDMIRAVCEVDGDPEDAVTPSELKSAWERPGFNLATDAWVVTDPTGKVVGYEEFVSREGHAIYQGDGYVHPQFNNLGVGTSLLQAQDGRARREMTLADPSLRSYIQVFTTLDDSKGRPLLENEGFQAVRFTWHMHIALESAPPAAQFPAGIELRPFVEAEHLYPVYEALEEAFADHWGHVKPSFETWKSFRLAPDCYEPELWFVAWDGDQIAGVSICRYRGGIGFVWSLGVRRPWRKQGLGMALLLHSFGEFYKRGQTVIGLAVDASSPTGATRLYERAGMHVEREYVCYEKEFQPGSTPSGMSSPRS